MEAAEIGARGKTRGQSPWLLPAVGAVLIVILGPVVNIATDLKTNWIAWAVYGVLAVASVLVTVLIARRSSSSNPGGGVVIQNFSRTKETTHPDGSKTVERFSEEVAVRFFDDDLEEDDE